MERWFSNYSGMLSLIIFTAVGIATVLVMARGSTVLIPIIISVAIWFALNGATNALQRLTIAGWQMPRMLAMILVLLITVQISIAVSFIFMDSFTELSQKLPTYTENVTKLTQSIPQSVWSLLPEQYANLFSSSVDGGVQQASGAFPVW